MKTRVLFVYPKYNDGQREVLALFPDELERDMTITCYARVGQHSTAHRSFLKRVKATKEQYTPLARELTSIGYELCIINEVP